MHAWRALKKSKKNDVKAEGIVFYDVEVRLGTVENNNQSQTPVRLVGYHVDSADYWIATDRRDLTAEQIAEIYKLRWNIENFFAWWKRHLRVYHLIARSPYGLMVQILAGLITYLLLAIHCHENHGEPVTIKRVRELRLQILNEQRHQGNGMQNRKFSKNKTKTGHKQKKNNRTLLPLPSIWVFFYPIIHKAHINQKIYPSLRNQSES